MAIDSRAHLLISDYNLNKQYIFRDLMFDRTFINPDITLPGRESGLLTLTNAHFISNLPTPKVDDGIRKLYNLDYGFPI